MKPETDAIDRLVLMYIQQHPYCSYSEIGNSVALTKGTVYCSVERLVRANKIYMTGWGIQTNGRGKAAKLFKAGAKPEEHTLRRDGYKKISADIYVRRAHERCMRMLSKASQFGVFGVVAVQLLHGERNETTCQRR